MDCTHLVHILAFNNYFNSYRKCLNLHFTFFPTQLHKEKWLSVVHCIYYARVFCRKLKNILYPPWFWIYLKGYSYLAAICIQISQRKQKLGTLLYIHISIKVVYVISGLDVHRKHRSQNWCLIHLISVKTVEFFLNNCREGLTLVWRWLTHLSAHHMKCQTFPAGL